MSNFLLDFLSLGAILSGILVITSKNPVISVLFLISVFVNVAGYLVLLGIGFVGISYLIVYIGAIAVLFLFVIMMLNLQLAELNTVGSEYTQSLPLGAILGSLFLFELVSILPFSFKGIASFDLSNITNTIVNIFVGMINSTSMQFIGVNNTSGNLIQAFDVPSAVDANFTNFLQIQSIGQNLYTYGAIWLLLTSLILLLAMVGPISLTMNKSDSNATIPLSQPVEIQKLQRDRRFYSTNSRPPLPSKHYQRHNRVKKIIQKGNAITNLKELIEQSLDLTISDKMFNDCLLIVSNPVTLCLPYAHTDASKVFSKLVGPYESSDPIKRKAGCYHIHPKGEMFNTGYVGQSIILGNRVRRHMLGLFNTTADFIKSLDNNGQVTLYIVPSTIVLSEGITMSQFLTVLEQYLFFTIQPSINISMIASHGVYPSSGPKTYTKAQMNSWMKLYIYSYNATTDFFY